MREKFERKALQMAIIQSMANTTATIANKDMNFGVAFMPKFLVVRDFLAETAKSLFGTLSPERANEASNEELQAFCDIVDTNTEKFLVEFNEAQVLVPNELSEEMSKLFMSAPLWVDFLATQMGINEFAEKTNLDPWLITLVSTSFLTEAMEVAEMGSSEVSGILH